MALGGIIKHFNVGKSTLFNCLTEAGIAAENYAIELRRHRRVPDPRLDALSGIDQARKFSHRPVVGIPS